MLREIPLFPSARLRKTLTKVEDMLRRSLNIAKQLAMNVRDLDKVLVNQGRLLCATYKDAEFSCLQDAEFQIFSQWGEDGIIQYLTQNIEIEHKTFVEFGVETFREANCRFLMQKDFWSGMVIDGSTKHIAKIKNSNFFWRHDLTAIEAFISRENIAELIDRAPLKGIGILSVDIDGVDYFVLEALGHLKPAIIIVEYNGLFGPTATVSVPYSADFWRTKAHHSNLYYGASIAAFDYLLASRSYKLVGGNMAGNNAFFVREDLLTDKIRPVSVADAFRETSFAEGRRADGTLDFVRGLDRRAAIADLPLYDVNSGETLRVSDLPTA
ncbi:hypothetical protein [Sphingomonas sp.]|uniref:hypothetical protein n=1 Tax=Sphingomonas sp. TaxID=28214 RepID=UPI001EB5E538|nr:hypothetical protein [Sphingomonas sp.]MBX3593340.1 hypothetical protein [Sphingomonas sp.]